MRRYVRLLCIGLLVAVVGTGCEETADPSALFERLSPDRTGVTFANELSPSPDLNIVNWPYFYNGGGVAAGDVNGDGLVDLYFTANQESNRLYLNQGDFRFEEVTEAAGVGGAADWSNGVTMADVNGDGRLDLYVSVVYGYASMGGHNELYINQGVNGNGVPQFEEQAEAYGLDQYAYGVQSLFFDYDGDGDLDVYLLNAKGNRSRRFPRGTARQQDNKRVGDRLYRNDDSTFVEVTDAAGLYHGPTGAGLGVVASDLDHNGCPDLYIANDFFEHDYLYYNNCDGTFTESIRQSTRHISYSSMGVDAADYNNDGRPDITVLDMLPAQERILKTTEPSDPERIYRVRRQAGYHHQLDRNTLQLNQGNRRFSEIGLLAGIAATDWSWAPLFADLDNDGRKDLFVTNGIYRRPNDLDYFQFAMQEGLLDSLERGDTEPYKELQKRMPHVPVSNFAFHNRGPLSFSDSTSAWGLDHPGFSNGAAYADLNNDGALDLVTNNVNAPAAIYKNRADTLRDHHYLTVRLEGEGANTQGIGAKVKLYQGNRTQLLEQMPTRGYQSSVDPRLHFGLGTQAIDSLTIVWPDGRSETRTSVARDQTLTLQQVDATSSGGDLIPRSDEPLFRTVDDALSLDFQHEENTAYNDFRREPLMPHKLSREGPAMAMGDVNGDERDDVYLGGANGQAGALYVQQPDGRFRRSAANNALWAADKAHEDVDAAFFDANGDTALDLYVVSAGNEARGNAAVLRDRLYLNDGTGDFRRTEGTLPEDMIANGGAVAPGDFDADGDMDLFVGSRVVSGAYGKTPTSYLLENDGAGHFTDVTDDIAPGLREVGMVTDATWTDLQGRDALDLVVVGEWMPITVFGQQGDRWIDRTDSLGLAETRGWWQSIHAADLNGDGATELIAGNFGLNSRLQASSDEPVRLYLNDFDENGRPDPILTRYNDGTSYVWARRDELVRRLPSLKGEFPTYESFGAGRIEDLFSAEKIQDAIVKEVHTFASVYVEKQGNSNVAVNPLPQRAQFAPVHGIVSHDLDGDGARDIILGGNFHGVKPKQGRYDASYGTVLLGNSAERWRPMPPPESGLYLEGEVRAFHLLRRTDGQHCLLAARNNAVPQVACLRSRSNVQ